MNILKSNGEYSFYNELTISHELEVKNYTFEIDLFGPKLKDAEDFTLPEKIYDVDEELRSAARKRFKHTDQNLGVLLTGKKGQGKSVTAKLLAKELGLPVVMITKSIPREIDFVGFLNNIKQDYCLFIDEFEKLFPLYDQYDDQPLAGMHNQQSFLSFMDGVQSSNKIFFLLTTNTDVNEYMLNRPSRIRFMKRYDELSKDVFEMVVKDRLVNMEFKDDLVKNLSFLNMNVDLLISIIDDINLFNKPFSEFKYIYNYSPEEFKYKLYFRESEKDVEKEVDTLILNDKLSPTSLKNRLQKYTIKQILATGNETVVFKGFKGEHTDQGYQTSQEGVYRLTPDITSTLLTF